MVSAPAVEVSREALSMAADDKTPDELEDQEAIEDVEPDEEDASQMKGGLAGRAPLAD